MHTHARIHQKAPKGQISCWSSEWKTSSEKGWGLGGWGWRLEGIRADEKEMTDMRLNVAKINKDTHHPLVCALITLKEHLIWFFLYLPLFLSPLHVWSLLQTLLSLTLHLVSLIPSTSLCLLCLYLSFSLKQSHLIYAVPTHVSLLLSCTMLYVLQPFQWHITNSL